uniref:Uncharacterized protein n=1 Tax=viral metagenome TaxID=1070528 RepID=A0A6C0CRX8_9ZZZZ
MNTVIKKTILSFILPSDTYKKQRLHYKNLRRDIKRFFGTSCECCSSHINVYKLKLFIFENESPLKHAICIVCFNEYVQTKIDEEHKNYNHVFTMLRHAPHLMNTLLPEQHNFDEHVIMFLALLMSEVFDESHKINHTSQFITRAFYFERDIKLTYADIYDF